MRHALWEATSTDEFSLGGAQYISTHKRKYVEKWIDVQTDIMCRYVHVCVEQSEVNDRLMQRVKDLKITDFNMF